MGLFDFLNTKKQEKSIRVEPIAALPAQLVLRQFGASPVLYYGDNTDVYLRKGYESNHVIFTLADWCGKKMTVAPPILYRTKNKVAAKRYKQLMKANSFENVAEKVILKNLAFEEIEEHPILDLLNQPNQFMNWDEFVYGYYIFKQFVGNATIQGVWTENGINAGKIQQLWLLPSNYIQAYSGEGLNMIDYYVDSRNPTEKIPTEQICKIRNFSADYQTPGSQLQGQSVLKAAARLLKKSNEALDAETEALQNRGAAKLIFPKLNGEQLQNLADEVQVDAINEGMRKRLREAGNQGVVVNSIPLDSITIGMSPVDLQILETQKADTAFWASLFHIDTRVVLNSHESSTRDNMQTARLYSITDGVLPHLTALANALNNWLIPTYKEDGLFLDFDDSVFPEMQREYRETAKQMKEAEVFTTNEIRAVLKYGNYDGENGDKILVSTNKQILDDLSNVLPDSTVQAGY